MTIVRGRSKKKIFGRKRASYDARIDKIVNNDKRVPRDIQILDCAITPAMDKTMENVISHRNYNKKFGETILSSLTIPTITTSDEKRKKIETFSTGCTILQSFTSHNGVIANCNVDNNKEEIIHCKKHLTSTKKRLTYDTAREKSDPTKTIQASESTSHRTEEGEICNSSIYPITTSAGGSNVDDEEKNITTGTFLFPSHNRPPTETKSLRHTKSSIKRKSSENRMLSDREVLRDMTNDEVETYSCHLKSNLVTISKTYPAPETLVTAPRSKSARKKQKLLSTSSSLSSSIVSRNGQNPRKMHTKFFVPAHEPHKNGEYHAPKYFGLVEGMGGGDEEIDRGSNKPHRGRLLELPGAVLPGIWEADIHDSATRNNEHREELRALSISLRHVSASSTLLEQYYVEEEPTPSGMTVSVVNPSVNRVSAFIKQGVFTNEEIDFCVEGEDKLVNNSSFLSCLLLATFDGFTSSSDSTNDAEDCSEAMLARCVWPDDDGDRSPEECPSQLHMFGSENESEATGVLFPCKLDFDYEYYILILHDTEFHVSAIDVMFRSPKPPRRSSTPQSRLTELMLNEHQLYTGYAVGEIMERFMAEQLTMKDPEACPQQLDVGFHVDSLHPMEKMVGPEDGLREECDNDEMEIKDPTNSDDSNTTLRTTNFMQQERADDASEVNIQSSHSTCDEHDKDVGGIISFDRINDGPVGEDGAHKNECQTSAKKDKSAYTAEVEDRNRMRVVPNSVGVDSKNKTLLHRRLSNICRTDQLQQKKDKSLMHKRRLPCNNKVESAKHKKRLRRVSDATTSVFPSVQRRSLSRKKTRRATFPSTRRERDARNTDVLKSMTREPRAVVVVDLFGETESMFGCTAIHHTNRVTADSSSKRERPHEKGADKVITDDGIGIEHTFVSAETITACFDKDALSMARNDSGNDSYLLYPPGTDVGTKQDDAYLDDALSIDSIHGGSFLLGSDDNQDKEVTTSHSASIAQPLFDVYFGRATESSTSEISSPYHCTNVSFEFDSQPFHDYYYGQEHDVSTFEDEALSNHPPHGIYFGLRNASDSSTRSYLDMSLLSSPKSCAVSQPFYDHYYCQENYIGEDDTEQRFWLNDGDSSTQSDRYFLSLASPPKIIPFYDHYFGQEQYIIERLHDEAIQFGGKGRRFERYYVVQSQPLMVIMLFAGMISFAL